MHIKDVVTAIKIGDVVLRDDENPNFIKMKYTHTDDELLIQNTGRVYLITSDGIIKKIGGSSSRGGIKSTMSFYVNSQSGSPGPSRFITQLLIRDELLKGRKVEIFMITSPLAISRVNGLFGFKEIEVASFSEMETMCKEDYKRIEGQYPKWNFKENGDDYPSEYSKLHNSYHQRRLRRD